MCSRLKGCFKCAKEKTVFLETNCCLSPVFSLLGGKSHVFSPIFLADMTLLKQDYSSGFLYVCETKRESAKRDKYLCLCALSAISFVLGTAVFI